MFGSDRKKRALREAGWGYTAICAVVGLVYFSPVMWMILTAFKTRPDALATPPKLFFTPTFDNFVREPPGESLCCRRCRNWSCNAAFVGRCEAGVRGPANGQGESRRCQ